MDELADTDLISVFHAEDPELLPLAESALEQEHIEYLIRRAGLRVPVGFGHAPEFGGAEGPADILVRPGDADRAREVLMGLAATRSATPAPSPGPAAPVPAAGASREPRVARLRTEGGATVGDISERQLQFLVDQLEEESDSDRDYYIDAATIDMLEADGADGELIGMLRRALGASDGVEISWSRL